MSKAVVEMSAYFGDGIGAHHGKLLAEEILTAYYYLKLEDVIVALQQLKKKDKVYKLTLNVILSHMEEYATERMRMYAEVREAEQANVKEVPDINLERFNKEFEKQKNNENRIKGNERWRAGRNSH